MARTALVAQAIADTGLEPVLTAANVAGHTMNPGEILEVVNGAGADITVTLVTGGTYRGKDIADTAITVTAGERRLIRVGQADLYAQPAGADQGKVYVDFSSVTTVSVAAYSIE